MWAQKQVTVVVDGRASHVRTQALDVAGALAEAGVSVDAGDVVTPSEDTRLDEGMTILVRHSVPVTIELAGERVELDVVGESVADALVAAGIDPATNTAVTPALTSPLIAGMTIEAPDTFVRVEREEARVSPKVETRPDPTLKAGTKKVVASGAPGRVLRVYRVLVTNGVEGPRQLTAERVVAEPISRVVIVGTGSHVMPAFATRGFGRMVGKAPRSGRRLSVVATAYSAAQPGLSTHTATGRRATYGVIAVDPRVIPLGTRVWVPGYGYAIAADTGGAIKGNRIDVCFDSVAECVRWGRRTVTIVVLD